MEQVGLNPYKLAKIAPLHEQYVYKLCRGQQRPTDETLEKLVSISQLSVNLDELKGWRASDDYSKEQIFQALKDLHLSAEEKLALLKLFPAEELAELLPQIMKE